MTVVVHCSRVTGLTSQGHLYGCGAYFASQLRTTTTLTMADMDVDQPIAKENTTVAKEGKKRFEVKKVPLVLACVFSRTTSLITSI